MRVRSSYRNLASEPRNLAYEGASTGRRTEGWLAPDVGPNASLESDIDLLVRRSRAAYRNVAWIRRAIDSLVTNEIGRGITPRFGCTDKALRKRIQSLWNLWTSEADADGVLDFYGIQALAALERLIAGECFIRLRPRRLSDGLSVPLQLQLIETEQLPLRVLDTANLNIRMGIELSNIGKRVAYHFYKEHPGEWRYGISSYELVRVPAQSVIHYYQPVRAGQIRGEPACAASLFRTRIFDSYEDAELARKATRSQITGFVRRPIADPLYSPITGDIKSETLGQIKMQPGMIAELQPGEEITFADADDSGVGFSDFQREQKLAMAAGLDIPYEILSGDYSKVNDRIIRAMFGEFHRLIKQRQDNITIHQLCKGVVNNWLDMAVSSGALDIPGYGVDLAVTNDIRNCEWRTDAWPYLHALQDTQSKILQIKNGLTSRSAIIAEMGGQDVEDVDSQNADDMNRALGLDLEYELYGYKDAAKSPQDNQDNMDNLNDPNQ